MQQSKINLVYTLFPHLGSPTFATLGLEEELKRQGRLNYSYNKMGGEFIDEDKLKECPTLFILGHYAGFGPEIEACGNQFKATLQSESFFDRRGNVDASVSLIKTREKQFDLLFTFADTDLNIYNIPTVHTSPWADTGMIFPYMNPECFDLTFIGGRTGREDWLEQDKDGIIKIKNTELSKEPSINAYRYNDILNRHFFLVSLPGRNYNGICGRCWEILAAKRLCFQYLNPDTCSITSKYFEDGVDIVYWREMDELIEKYNYYKNNISEAIKISENGYNKFLKSHTQEHRAKFLSDKVIEYSGAMNEAIR